MRAERRCRKAWEQLSRAATYPTTTTTTTQPLAPAASRLSSGSHGRLSRGTFNHALWLSHFLPRRGKKGRHNAFLLLALSDLPCGGLPSVDAELVLLPEDPPAQAQRGRAGPGVSSDLGLAVLPSPWCALAVPHSPRSQSASKCV